MHGRLGMLTDRCGTRGDIDFKVLVFKAIVLSTLLSGLTAFVLSDKQYQTLGHFVVGRARVLLRGKACEKKRKRVSQGTGL